MTRNDQSTERGDSVESASTKRGVDEDLKQLQKKTGDLCETLDRIEKRLLETVGARPVQIKPWPVMADPVTRNCLSRADVPAM